MMFEHHFFPRLELSEETTQEGRHYTTPRGVALPSVTTVLGRMMDKKALENWRRLVGEDEAHRVTKLATGRGNLLHDAAEKFVLNEEGYAERLILSELDLFKQLRPYLEQHLGKVFGVELPLYSTALWTAGRTDLVAEWDGIPSIIDYKTTKTRKEEKNILGYFLQASIYAFMASRIYAIKFPQIVIIMLSVHDKPQLFVKDSGEYLNKAVDLFLRHKEQINK